MPVPGQNITNEREVLFILRSEASSDTRANVKEFADQHKKAQEAIDTTSRKSSAAIQQDHKDALDRIKKEAEAAADAQDEAWGKVSDALLTVGDATVTLGSGIAALGIAGEEDIEKLAQSLVKLKGIVDASRGAIEVVRGITEAYRAYKRVVDAAVVSETALAVARGRTAGATGVGAAAGVGGAAVGGAAVGRAAAGVGTVGAGLGIGTALLALGGAAALRASPGLQRQVVESGAADPGTILGRIGAFQDLIFSRNLSLGRFSQRGLRTGTSEAQDAARETEKALNDLLAAHASRRDEDARRVQGRIDEASESAMQALKDQQEIRIKMLVGALSKEEAIAASVEEVNRRLEERKSILEEVSGAVEKRFGIGAETEESRILAEQVLQLEFERANVLQEQFDVIKQQHAHRIEQLNVIVQKEEQNVELLKRQEEIAKSRFETDVERFAKMGEIEREQARNLAARLREGGRIETAEEAEFARRFQETSFQEAASAFFQRRGLRFGAAEVFSSDNEMRVAAQERELAEQQVERDRRARLSARLSQSQERDRRAVEIGELRGIEIPEVSRDTEQLLLQWSNLMRQQREREREQVEQIRRSTEEFTDENKSLSEVIGEMIDDMFGSVRDLNDNVQNLASTARQDAQEIRRASSAAVGSIG